MTDHAGPTPVDVLTLGETMVALRHEGPLAVRGRFETFVAGSESNTAIGVARLGHSVAWVSRLGTDPFGDLVARELRAEGVDVSLVERDPVRPTGLMTTLNTPAGLRVDYRRAGSAASAVSADLVTRAAGRFSPRMVLGSGITAALSDQAFDAMRTMLRLNSTATRVLVVNYRAQLWSTREAAARLRPLLDEVDVVVASHEELAVIHDGEASTLWPMLAEHGVRLAALTEGSGGATVWSGAVGALHADALPVRVVDTLGAGDAFTAGLVSGLLDGLTLAETLHRGLLLGAHCVAARGDWEGLPTRATLALGDGDQTRR